MARLWPTASLGRSGSLALAEAANGQDVTRAQLGHALTTALQSVLVPAVVRAHREEPDNDGPKDHSDENADHEGEQHGAQFSTRHARAGTLADAMAEQAMCVKNMRGRFGRAAPPPREVKRH